MSRDTDASSESGMSAEISSVLAMRSIQLCINTLARDHAGIGAGVSGAKSPRIADATLLAPSALRFCGVVSHVQKGLAMASDPSPVSFDKVAMATPQVPVELLLLLSLRSSPDFNFVQGSDPAGAGDSTAQEAAGVQLDGELSTT